MKKNFIKKHFNVIVFVIQLVRFRGVKVLSPDLRLVRTRQGRKLSNQKLRKYDIISI